MSRLRTATVDKIVSIGAWNAPFVIAMLFGASVPMVFQVPLVAWVLFVAPGLALTDRRGLDAFSVVASIVVRSTISVFGCWVVLAILPGPIHRELFLVMIALLVNFGLVRGYRMGWFPALPWQSPFARRLGIVALLFLLQSFVGAAYRIPPLEDQDMEVQGTAYGLVHALSPTMVTNRGTTHFFAHPPLLHVWIGLSMLVTDELDALRFYHEEAVAAEGESRAQLDERFGRTFEQFERTPHLLGTRTPTVIFGVLTMILLALLIRELTGSDLAAIGGAVLYATLPEVYVRSAYGGYMAVTNLWALLVIRSYLAIAGLLPDATKLIPAHSSLVASVMGSLANQKSVLVAAAAGLHGLIGSVADAVRTRQRDFWRSRQLVAGVWVATGFAVGWLLFAAWGANISRPDFISDHLRAHFVDRFQLNSVWLTKPAGSLDKYPSIGALWAQYAAHIGWLLIPAGLLALGHAVRRFKGAEGVMLTWFVIGGIVFSVVDWRQTKHLALILPPLMVLIAIFWSVTQGRVRQVLTAFLVSGILYNLWRIAMLMNDFTFMVPYRMW